MEWIGEAQESRGVFQREFRVDSEGRSVPGLLWTPTEQAKALVLIGHGGSNNKSTDYVVAVARQLVRRNGFAAAAIDGPVHGARRNDDTDGMEIQNEFGRLWASNQGMLDEMNADWRNTLDELQAADGVGDSIPVGYWGLSMGTMLGLPFCAQEPRISAATLGLMGSGEQGRLADAARNLTCPVMYFVQWDDQLIPRDGAIRLFDLIASEHKRLRASPGGHPNIPAEEFTAGISFLVDQLS